MIFWLFLASADPPLPPVLIPRADESEDTSMVSFLLYCLNLKCFPSTLLKILFFFFHGDFYLNCRQKLGILKFTCYIQNVGLL